LVNKINERYIYAYRYATWKTSKQKYNDFVTKMKNEEGAEYVL